MKELIKKIVTEILENENLEVQNKINEPYINSKEAAQIIGISEAHLKRLRSEGVFTAYYKGKPVRYKASEVWEWVQKNLNANNLNTNKDEADN